MIRGVIFDLGSTLIHFSGDWPTVIDSGLDALTASLREQGLAVDASAFREAFREETEGSQRGRALDFVERTSAAVLRLVLTRYGYPDVEDAIVERAVAALFAVSEAHWEPMPGLSQTLTRLRDAGLRLGMISNASDAANVQRLIEKAQIQSWFDPIVISAAVGIRKPDPRLFERVLEDWELPAEEVIMIGDTLGEDIRGAQSAGIFAIWITADADTPANQAHAGTIHPDASVAALQDVPDLILSLNGKSPRG
jgi:HAD superfamily hydrolase (TIGR01662 family)